MEHVMDSGISQTKGKRIEGVILVVMRTSLLTVSALLRQKVTLRSLMGQSLTSQNSLNGLGWKEP